jgi:hypothetical protein
MKILLQGSTFKILGLNIFENCPNSLELVTLAPTFRCSISKMALYHVVSSRPTSRDLSPTLEDADLEEVLMGYPNISQAPFTNLVAFKRTCMMCLRSLVEGIKTPQYLAFTDVSQESLDEINKIGKKRRGWLPCMTIL